MQNNRWNNRKNNRWNGNVCCLWCRRRWRRHIRTTPCKCKWLIRREDWIHLTTLAWNRWCSCRASSRSTTSVCPTATSTATRTTTTASTTSTASWITSMLLAVRPGGTRRRRRLKLRRLRRYRRRRRRCPNPGDPSVTRRLRRPFLAILLPCLRRHPLPLIWASSGRRSTPTEASGASVASSVTNIIEQFSPLPIFLPSFLSFLLSFFLSLSLRNSNLNGTNQV